MTSSPPPAPPPVADPLQQSLLRTSSAVLQHQRRVEQELRDAKNALETQAQELAANVSLLHATLESAPDGIIAVNLHGTVVAYNSRLLAMWQLPASLMARRSAVEILQAILPRVKDRAALRRLSSEIARRPEQERVDVIELLDGRSLERRASPQTINGAIVGVVAQWRDVSERRRVEAAERARDIAEQADRAKSEFLTRMSHELRTPLNAIIGFSGLMDMDTRDVLAPSHRAMLAHVHRAGHNLLALIDDVTDVSRLQSGLLKVELQPVRVDTLLDEVFADLSVAARAAGVQLGHGPSQCTAIVQADRLRLRQVLTNVLSNAVKYNVRGGAVQVDCTAHGEQVTISVVDTGIGMTAAQLANLFKPFDRLGREAGSIEGTGIGLVIVQGLLALMSGSVQVQSHPGKGTTVAVALPAAVDRTAAIDVVPPAALAVHAGIVGKLLYVEDNAVNRALIEALLAYRPSVSVELASTIAEARQRLLTAHFNVVMTDILLPDGSGLDVLLAVRQDARNAGAACVAVSASELEGYGDFDRFLPKPINLPVLLMVLDGFLPRAAS